MIYCELSDIAIRRKRLPPLPQAIRSLTIYTVLPAMDKSIMKKLLILHGGP